MTDEIKKQANGSVSFQLEIPWEKIQTTYQQLLKQTAQHLEIKGFRKGKAPLPLVEKHLDPNKVYGRALEKLLPQIYSQFIHKHHLKPLTEPKITPVKAKLGEPWTFKVEIAEKPQVKLGNYKTYLKKALQSFKAPKKDPQDKKLKLIFDTLLEKAQLEVADLLVETEYKAAISKLVHQLDHLNLTLEDYAHSLKKSLDQLIEEYKTTAQDKLKLEFILSRLIEIEKPTIKDEELAKFKAKPEDQAYFKYLLQKQKVIDNLLKL